MIRTVDEAGIGAPRGGVDHSGLLAAAALCTQADT
jgi:hypothetical protein